MTAHTGQGLREAATDLRAGDLKMHEVSARTRKVLQSKQGCYEYRLLRIGR